MNKADISTFKDSHKIHQRQMNNWRMIHITHMQNYVYERTIYSPIQRCIFVQTMKMVHENNNLQDTR